MKKLSLYIFLVLMWCNVSYAKLINLECTYDLNIAFDKNFNSKPIDKEWTNIYSFNLNKKILADTNFQNNPPVPAIINDNKIIWMIGSFVYGDLKTTNMFNIKNYYYRVLYHKIDRYTGSIRMESYELGLGDFFDFNRKTQTSKEKFKTFDGLMEKANNNRTQRETVYSGYHTGKCKKVEKSKKF